MTGTEIMRMQCWMLCGSIAILGKRPWYVGPAMTWCGFRSLRQSGPTTTTAGPRNLTKCHPVPVMVNRSLSSETPRRISSVVWCWNSRYISIPIRPMFLNMLLNCMYSGYDPNPSKLPTLAHARPPTCTRRGHLHVVVVNRQHMGDLRKRFSQMRLVKVTGVVVEVGMRHVLLVRCRPDRVLARF